ncbi:MAG: hypothetical protein LBH45_04370 [Campylobacteraceae bacterium]|jgi:hypothetical protein|nr:hypothetical protein [Campylobacteraceae bacterium]
MQETISLLENILLYSVIFFILCAFTGFIISLKSKNFRLFKKRLSFLNPTYYLFFSIITFSFVITLILKKHFVLIDALFAALLMTILFGGIKIYKLGKIKTAFENLKSFAVKKYCFDILICALFYLFITMDVI